MGYFFSCHKCQSPSEFLVESPGRFHAEEIRRASTTAERCFETWLIASSSFASMVMVTRRLPDPLVINLCLSEI